MSRAQPSGVAALLSDYRNYAGGRLWLALGLMILGALAEGFGLLMIVPLASIAIGGGDARIARFAPWATGWSGDRRFIAALALFLGAMAARSALLFARDVLLARLAAGYEADLRLRAASTLASRGWPFASRIGQAGMQALLLSDVPRAAQAISHVQGMAAGATMLVIAARPDHHLVGQADAVALLFLAVAFLLSVRDHPARRHERICHRRGDGRCGRVGVQAPRGPQGGARAGNRAGVHRRISVKPRASTRQVSGFVRDYSSARHWAAFGAALAAAALLLVGVRAPCPAVSGAGRQPGPVRADERPRTAPSEQRAAGGRRRAGLCRDRAAARTAGSAVASAASPEPLEWERVELDRRRVSSINQAWVWPARRSLSTAASGSESVAPPALARRRLLDLVAGLLAPQRGAITVDGRALHGDLEQWRAGIAYVGQEGIVFNDSVRGNLLAEGAAADDVGLLAERLRLSGSADASAHFPTASTKMSAIAAASCRAASASGW